MKEEILSIASDLREGSMTAKEAKEQLLVLFGVGQSFYCDERDKSGKTECGHQCMVCCRDEIASQ